MNAVSTEMNGRFNLEVGPYVHVRIRTMVRPNFMTRRGVNWTISAHSKDFNTHSSFNTSDESFVIHYRSSLDI